MAVFVKFYPFVEALAEKVHNLGSDTLKVALTNTAPNQTDDEFADIAEISAGSGYTAGGSQATQASSSQSGGLYKLVLNDVVWLASGGNIGPFRFVVLYNDTPAGKNLIGFFDYGASVTTNNGETFTVDFDATLGALTLS